MVREVRTGWNDDQPMPEELRRPDWDWDDIDHADLPQKSNPKRPSTKPRVGPKTKSPKSE